MRATCVRAFVYIIYIYAIAQGNQVVPIIRELRNKFLVRRRYVHMDIIRSNTVNKERSLKTSALRTVKKMFPLETPRRFRVAAVIDVPISPSKQ